jgi:flagellar biosynthesis regulator FlaF
MSPEQHIQQAQCHIQPVDTMRSEAAQLDSIAAQLMAVQRHWSDPERTAHLATALAASRTVWGDIQRSLAEGALALPLEVRHNLLILSVYADCKISACEGKNPNADMLGSLISLTRTLAGSLKEWRVAA